MKKKSQKFQITLLNSMVNILHERKNEKKSRKILKITQIMTLLNFAMKSKLKIKKWND